MANKIPLAIADFETSLSVAISAGATSLTLSSATDDDGNALPAGKYCFTVNNGSSNKQYLLGQLNGTAVTSVVSVSRQGVETSGAAFAARAGSPIIISDFATIQRVADILRGQIDLDGASPIGYDAEPTLADRKDLATVGYVLDTASGGTVNFDSLTCAGNAGEAIVAGNLVYFNTADQEWYKTDADTAATVDNVQLGIALGTGSDGVAITGGIQIAGTWTTSALTAGSLYYASNTAGAIGSSAGTTSRVIGIALSTTKLLLIQRTPKSLKDNQEVALLGGGDFGTPSSINKFITQSYNSSATGLPVVTVYTTSGSPHTWTKPTGLKYVSVELCGGGGGGPGFNPASAGSFGGGGGGGYSKKFKIAAASLGATETVTVGSGGAAGEWDSSPTAGGNGGTSSFGSHLSATGGTGGPAGGSGTAAGGTGSGGDINISGDTGIEIADSHPLGGGSFLGFGAMSNGSTSWGPSGYGGGGSGAVSNDVAPTAGAAGIVIVTEYYS